MSSRSFHSKTMVDKTGQKRITSNAKNHAIPTNGKARASDSTGAVAPSPGGLIVHGSMFLQSINSKVNCSMAHNLGVLESEDREVAAACTRPQVLEWISANGLKF